jgi:hypothetical protein
MDNEHSQSVSAVSLATSSGMTIAGRARRGVRWEDSKYGHVQLGAIFRDIGVKGPIVGNQNTFGWGVNLSTSLNVFDRDSMQGQLTYGQGLFRYLNDDFQNNDAAFNSSGNLTAIPAFGAMIGYTHK